MQQGVEESLTVGHGWAAIEGEELVGRQRAKGLQGDALKP